MRYCHCIRMTMKSSVTCSYSGGRVTYYGVYDFSGVVPAFMNAHKWLLTNFDCSALWLKDRNALIQSLSTNPEFLRNMWSSVGNLHSSVFLWIQNALRVLKPELQFDIFL